MKNMSERLQRIQQLSYRLNSSDLRKLATWAGKRANEVWRKERIAVMKAYPVGTEVVLGNTNFPEWSGKIVTVAAHGRTRIKVEKHDKESEVTGVRYLTIPYTSHWIVKGLMTPENLNLAKGEVEVNKTLEGMVNALFTGVKA